MSNEEENITTPPPPTDSSYSSDNKAVCNSFRQRQAADPISIALKVALRALAVEAGAETFAVPFCGAGGADHHISTKTNKCVSCGRLRKLKNDEAASAAKALKASNRNINNQPKESK